MNMSQYILFFIVGCISFNCSSGVIDENKTSRIIDENQTSKVIEKNKPSGVPEGLSCEYDRHSIIYSLVHDDNGQLNSTSLYGFFMEDQNKKIKRVIEYHYNSNDILDEKLKCL